MELPPGVGAEGHPGDIPDIVSGPAMTDSVPGPEPKPLEDLAGPLLDHNQAEEVFWKDPVEIKEVLMIKPYSLGKERKLGQQYAALSKILSMKEQDMKQASVLNKILNKTEGSVLNRIIANEAAEQVAPEREAEKQANMDKLGLADPAEFGVKNKGLLVQLAEEHGIGELLGYSFRTNKIEVIGTEKILLLDYDLSPLHSRDVYGIDLSEAEPAETEEAPIEEQELADEDQEEIDEDQEEIDEDAEASLASSGKQYKYSELSETAQRTAVDDYLKGWEETHDAGDLTTYDAHDALMDTDDECVYTIDGDLIEEESEEDEGSEE